MDSGRIDLMSTLVSRNVNLQDRRTSVRLEPKVMQVLLCLADNAGRTVSRDQLMAEVWNGAIVSEDAVNRCISRIRKVFSDGSVKIATVPKIGYRFEGD